VGSLRGCPATQLAYFAAVIAPPPCSGLGPQCRDLDVVLRVTDTEDGVASADDEATWLFGHTERIAFGSLRSEGDTWWVEARLLVPCHFLKEDPASARCAAHGFQGALPAAAPSEVQPRQLGGDRFRLVQDGELVTGEFPTRARSLPVIQTENPCLTAPCQTADQARGAACCRDLQLDIRCDPEDQALELLVRARKEPHFRLVDWVAEGVLGAEMISACAYLDSHRNCTLHDRFRANGEPAKPTICYAWPEPEDVFHDGCAFGSKTLPISPD